MNNEKIWEKRKLYSGYDCYIHKEVIEKITTNDNPLSIDNIQVEQPNKKKRHRIIIIDNPDSNHELESRCDIILAQDDKMLGYIQMNIWDDKTASITSRNANNLLLEILPPEIEQYREMISKEKAAIFVNPEYRR